jgi:hypothetical protein
MEKLTAASTHGTLFSWRSMRDAHAANGQLNGGLISRLGGHGW